MVARRLTFKTDNFQCHLQCGRCSHIKANGQQCGNRVCFGAPVCWIHNKQRYGVQIKDSGVHGKGLFATRPFLANVPLCPYEGENISTRCLNNRYPGNTTAPYAVTKSRYRVLDSACRRGIGSMANGLFYRGRPIQRNRHNAVILPLNQTLWIVSTRNITQGEEIFVWYGNDYRLENNHRTYRSQLNDTRPC